MKDYKNFKSLLEYFVSHLEYCVTQDKNGRGYDTYIKNVKNFKKSGYGDKGHKIQEQIKKWEDYENGKICFNVNATGYREWGCYLKWKDIASNVRGVWNNNEVVKLQIYKNSTSKKKAIFIKDSEFSCQELGLFDGNPPNEKLKIFFDIFNDLIIEHNQRNQ
ncbi:MAG: hypothetical protein BWX59_02302 [Bacteroidetes bacterium ADurb.Bin028]|nr:MAG: hypothetical protein BWX59_02302 [Bacteroidetes bacterium ADurb.Bin028]HOD88727.1 hypothetical protein [Bacteroidales bacterium]